LKQAATGMQRLKRAFFVRLIRWCQAQDEWRIVPPPRPRPTPAVQQALALAAAAVAAPASSPALVELIGSQYGNLPTSRELFALDGEMLPCWLEGDLTLHDDWLSAENYYPLYYGLFRRLAPPGRKTRLLEIGVRTGYVGVAFAKAAQGAARYLGVDPNLYVRDGLRLAGATFQILRSKLADFEFALLEGYSWDTDIQDSLLYSGPFEIIHIDGDHTLPGKLLDLELARRLIAPGGIILVDDYEHHTIVSDAVGRALALGWFSEFAYVPTKRGLAILR
jgi:SAM-dependent methyltransferase